VRKRGRINPFFDFENIKKKKFTKLFASNIVFQVKDEVKLEIAVLCYKKRSVLKEKI
jgi:hypothetical protein